MARRTRAERGFSIALGCFAAVLALYLFLQSPFFHFEELIISGPTSFTSQEVMAIAGLQPGQNLFDIDLGIVAERLRAEPRVKRARAQRRLPSQLDVYIEERVAVAVLATGNGLWRVDADGYVIDAVQGVHSLVIITAAEDVDPVAAGERVGHPALRAAVGVSALLPRDLAARLSEIRVTREYNLELMTREGIKVLFGAWRDSEEKLRVLSLLLEQLAAHKASPRVIDVRVPSNPTVH